LLFVGCTWSQPRRSNDTRFGKAYSQRATEFAERIFSSKISGHQEEWMATEIDEYRLSERRYRVPDRTSTDLNTEILEIRRVETPYSQNRRAETPYSQVSWTEHVSRRATVDGTERTASSDHWGGLHGNFGRPVGAFVDNGRDSRTQRIVHVSTHVVHGGVSLSLPACLSVSLSA